MFAETIDKDAKSFERKLGYQRSNSAPSTAATAAVAGAVDLLISEINHQLLKVGREIGGKKERAATKKVVLKALKSYVMVHYKMSKEVSMIVEAELLIGERIAVHGPEFRSLLDSFVCIYEDSGFSFATAAATTAATAATAAVGSCDNKDLEAKDTHTYDDNKDVSYNDEKNGREEEEEEVWTDGWMDGGREGGMD